MPRAKQLQQDTHIVHQAHFHSEKLAEHSNLLNDVKSEQNSTNNKLDTLSGAINNNIGDAQVKLQTYVYGYDSPNGLARPLAVNSNGELKVSNDVLEVSAETVNLNTDTLETKIQATNDKLDSFSGAGNNNIGEGSTKIQTYLYGRDVGNGLFRPLVCDSDAHLQVDCLTSALPTGGATEAKQDVIETTLTNIETSSQLIDDTVVAQSAAHPSKAFAVGGRYYVDNTFRDIRVDNIGKVIIDTPTGSDLDTRLATIGTNTTGLNNCVSGNELQVDVVSMPTTTVSGTITANLSSTDNAVLDAIAVDGDNIQTKLDTLEASLTSMESKQDAQETTLNAIQTAVEIIDNCISGNEAQVDVVSMPTTTITGTITANLSSTDNAVLDAIAVDGDNIQTKLDTLEASLTSMESKQDAQETTLNAIQTAVEIIDNCISGNEAQVDVVSMPTTTITGTITANLSATDNAVLDAIASDTTSLDGKITQGNDSTLTNAQQVLIYGKNGTGDLKPIHITNNGDVEVEIADFVKGQALMAASFPVVISSDQSTLNNLEKKIYSTLTTVDAALAVNAGANGDSSVVSNTDYNSVYHLQVVCSDAAYTDWTADVFQSIDASNFYKTFEDLNNGPTGPQSKLLTIVDRPASSWKLNIQNTGASNKTFAIKYIKA